MRNVNSKWYPVSNGTRYLSRAFKGTGYHLLALTAFLFLPSAIASQSANVAGTFYPATENELAGMVDSFLGQSARKPGVSPSALIVPHAGYAFSGKVAAAAFKQIETGGFDLVIILGAAHYATFDGAAIDPSGSFETPLGKVVIDEAAAGRIESLTPLVKSIPLAFKKEHSVEAVIPFLQRALREFKILPVLIQKPDPKAAGEIGAALATLVNELEKEGRHPLIVASTDLAHYPANDDARRSDDAVLEWVEKVDPDKMAQTSTELLKEGIPNLSTTMCGEAGVMVLLNAVRILGIEKGIILKRGTSADSPYGKINRTVGYAAVAFYSDGKGQRHAE